MTTEAERMAGYLENDGNDCKCAAYGACECACGANWAEYHVKDAAKLLRSQAAEIERLKDVEFELRLALTRHLQSKDALLRQALEALENSVDYAEGELTERTRMWSNLPSRAKHLTGLKELADAHVAAITAIKQHLGEV